MKLFSILQMNQKTLHLKLFSRVKSSRVGEHFSVIKIEILLDFKKFDVQMEYLSYLIFQPLI
jgi:hypothetical protein